MIEHALELVERGFKLLPLNPNDKSTFLREWPQNATDDAETVRNWWQHHPERGIGVLTGIRSGIVVIDIDNRPSANPPVTGLQNFRELMNGRDVRTLAVDTGGGGYHLYFKYPQAENVRFRNDIAPGVEIKANGRYVVAPPSLHPNGNMYRWRDESAEIADIPDWLFQLMVQNGETTSEVHTRAPDRDAVVRTGERNNKLTSFAGRLRHVGLEPEEIEPVLQMVNKRICLEPLSEAEISRIARSIGRYDAGAVSVPDVIRTEQRSGTENKCLTAYDLMRREIEECKWIAPSLIPEGLTILAGTPKVGKSFFALNLALEVSRGGRALQYIDVPPRRVLYLALEDTASRLQRRLAPSLQGEDAPREFHINLQWPRLDEGGLQQLEAWFETYPDTGLVVIDVLAMVLQDPKGNKSAYHNDYDAVRGLKELADRHGSAIVAIHHTRKQSADDPLHEVSGTTGLTGAADAIAVLQRESSRADATLYIRGRDIEEVEMALLFDPEMLRWSHGGDPADYRRSNLRQDIRDLLAAAGEPWGPKQVAEHLEQSYENTRQLMYQMERHGDLVRVDRGLYTCT